MERMSEDNSNDNLNKARHSLAHVLATAVLKHDPEVKIAIGPSTDVGFYYDFEFSEGKALGEENLNKLEKEMRNVLKRGFKPERKEISLEDARTLFKDQPYKLELIEEIAKTGEKITTYTIGDFTDLCEGPHVTDSKEIKPDSFKLSHVAGAYWRGDEKNIMLTRIYGVAFNTKEELGVYVEQLEEAKKRDHRKLGKELDLFTFSTLVGSGLPLWSPKGTVLRNELQNALLDISRKYGMLPVTIPHIAKRDLYEVSGHAQKFGDELLKVISHYGEFVMKPVNCPHHTQIYASKPRSYRDLPLRYMESTMQYRDEQPGEISGLTRVRSISVDDGHIFCRVDQIKEEAINIANIIKEFYSGLGLYGDHWVSLSVRDPNNPDGYVGEPKDWDKAEEMLQELSDELHLDARRIEGEAAIYGPKLDFIFKDSLGREWQLATIQIDFALPKRFGLTYTDSDGKDSIPVMIHRAILGSYERFLAILIEHYAGAFPLWLSPVQVTVLPISDSHIEYAKEITETLMARGLRAELDSSTDTLGKKIRNVKMQKTPYFLVIGDEEVKNKEVTLESRDTGKIGSMNTETLIEKLTKEISDKK